MIMADVDRAIDLYVENALMRLSNNFRQDDNPRNQSIVDDIRFRRLLGRDTVGVEFRVQYKGATVAAAPVLEGVTPWTVTRGAVDLMVDGSVVAILDRTVAIDEAAESVFGMAPFEVTVYTPEEFVIKRVEEDQ